MKSGLDIVIIGVGRGDPAPYVAVNKMIQDLAQSHIDVMFCEDGREKVLDWEENIIEHKQLWERGLQLVKDLQLEQYFEKFGSGRQRWNSKTWPLPKTLNHKMQSKRRYSKMSDKEYNAVLEQGQHCLESISCIKELMSLKETLRSLNIKSLNAAGSAAIRNAKEIIWRQYNTIDIKSKVDVENALQSDKVRLVLEQVKDHCDKVNSSKHVVLWLVDISYIEFFTAQISLVLQSVQPSSNNDLVKVVPLKILSYVFSNNSRERAARDKEEIHSNAVTQVQKCYDKIPIHKIELLEDIKTKNFKLSEINKVIESLSVVLITIPDIAKREDMITALGGERYGDTNINGNGIIYINPKNLDREIRRKLDIVQKYLRLSNKADAARQIEEILRIKEITSLKTRKSNTMLIIFPKYRSLHIRNIVQNWDSVKPAPKNVKFVIMGMAPSDPAGLGIINNLIEKAYSTGQSSVSIYQDELSTFFNLERTLEECKKIFQDLKEIIQMSGLQDYLKDKPTGRKFLDIDDNKLREILKEKLINHTVPDNMINPFHLKRIALKPELMKMKNLTQNHNIRCEGITLGFKDKSQQYIYSLGLIQKIIESITSNLKADNNIIVIVTDYPYIRSLEAYFRTVLKPIQQEYRDLHHMAVISLEIQSEYSSSKILEESKKIEVKRFIAESSVVKSIYQESSFKEISVKENSETKQFESDEVTQVIEELLLSNFIIQNCSEEKRALVQRLGGRVKEEKNGNGVVELNPNKVTEEIKKKLEINTRNFQEQIATSQVLVNGNMVSEASIATVPKPPETRMQQTTGELQLNIN